ncbi:HdeD family acid-resistance protein [Sanguibacter sp. Leaf3]|uniref:HdeD family acid-resistance protein n=1 Tax=Sanguibacter sp. Leaf3 TaxID=1736209 RepID=UPI0006FD4322|nr:DUF308 domain-containing protein [Sanguibacter sp. Leaf3]KQT99386.1 hypothetical protein ASG53_00450 [Sanguibacter sp. Leaf3]
MARTTATKSTPGGAGADGGTQGIELRKARGLWIMPLIRGLLLVLLGLLLMVQPLGTLDRLIMLFGVFLLLDGVVAAVQGLVNRDQIGWRWWLVQGAVDVVFAVLVLVWPSATALVLFYLLVVWTLVLGVAAIAGAVALVRNRDLGWPWLLTIGLLSTLFGFLLVTRSQDASAALELVTVVFGIYAFVSGAVHIVSVFAIRSVAQEIDRALTGRSLVVDAMAARQVAAREAAEERAEAKAAASAEKKAEKQAAKEHGRDGDRAARDRKVIHLPDGSEEQHGAGASGAVSTGGTGGAVRTGESSAEAHDRRLDDERAAAGFPDSPGIVEAPHPVVLDDQGSGRIPARTDRDGGAQAQAPTTPAPAPAAADDEVFDVAATEDDQPRTTSTPGTSATGSDSPEAEAPPRV